MALNSKTYYCFGATDKFSCKGINRRLNNITREMYLDVLESGRSQSRTNIGFRYRRGRIYTYKQKRAGFSYVYVKRRVHEDGVSTLPTLV